MQKWKKARLRNGRVLEVLEVPEGFISREMLLASRAIKWDKEGNDKDEMKVLDLMQIQIGEEEF